MAESSPTSSPARTVLMSTNEKIFQGIESGSYHENENNNDKIQNQNDIENEIQIDNENESNIDDVCTDERTGDQKGSRRLSTASFETMNRVEKLLEKINTPTRLSVILPSTISTELNRNIDGENVNKFDNKIDNKSDNKIDNKIENKSIEIQRNPSDDVASTQGLTKMLRQGLVQPPSLVQSLGPGQGQGDGQRVGPGQGLREGQSQGEGQVVQQSLGQGLGFGGGPNQVSANPMNANQEIANPIAVAEKIRMLQIDQENLIREQAALKTSQKSDEGKKSLLPPPVPYENVSDNREDKIKAFRMKLNAKRGKTGLNDGDSDYSASVSASVTVSPVPSMVSTDCTVSTVDCYHPYS